MSATIRPVTQREARDAVRRWHSHHKPHVGGVLALGAFGPELVGVVVMGRPVSATLAQPTVWEITRLAVGPDAPHCTASRLLGAAWRAAKGAGIRRLVSYTRSDELGTCYRAAGWRPCAVSPGTQNYQKGRGRKLWLPGLHVPSTEKIARVRWEIGPDAMPACVSRETTTHRGVA